MSTLSVTTGGLVRYDAACQAIAEAKAVDEAKEIRDRSEAMRAYARQAKNKQLEVDAAEIRIRAERRIGELMKAQRDAGLMSKGAKGNPGGQGATIVRVAGEPAQITLAEAGIDKNLADRARKYAAVPEEEWEEELEEWRERVSSENSRVTTRLERRGEESIRQEKQAQYNAVALPDNTRIVNDLRVLKGEQFSVVYADPPWQYGNQGTRAATDNHYVTMPTADICAMPVRELAAENAQLHLWTTNGFIREAFDVIEAWGFEYKSMFVWCKPQFGIGNYWRVSHELMLCAVRGSATFRDKSLRSWAELERGRHSAKPEVVREMVMRAFPGPYLEIFGRQAVEGWTVFGNEVEPTLFAKGNQ